MSIKHSLALLFSFLTLISAQGNYADSNKVAIDASSNYGFTVEYFENYKVVQNLFTNEKYALLCCNQGLANFSSAGYHAVVNTPLSYVGVDTELQSLPFFELLNISSSVQAVKPSANVTSPCFSGISDGPNSTSTAIDAIFTSQANNIDTVSKPQYISVSASNNTLTPLQQSAWVIFIAHFFDMEKTGQSIFNSISDKYTCHKSNLVDSGSKNIAWTTYDAANKAWSIRYDEYIHALVSDAGMKLIGENNKTTSYSNLTLFHQALLSADYIIDDSDAANFKAEFAYGDWLSAGGFNPNTNTFNFLTHQNVYRTDKLISRSGFSDWPIRHTARADLAISDVAHMVYSTYEPTYNMTWLRAFAQLGTSDFVSNSSYPSCTNAIERIEVNKCSINPFKPNSTVDNTTYKSTNPNVHYSLSAGSKAGIAIGVIGFVAVAVGAIVYFKRKGLSKPKEGTFYRMDDI